jgi:hypothetical protein
MSKVDAMRALKQARYDEQRRGAPAPSAAARPARPVVSAAAPPARAVPVVVAVPDELGGGVGGAVVGAACGHRNISGRTCTRETGHAEKSHRYS